MLDSIFKTLLSSCGKSHYIYGYAYAHNAKGFDSYLILDCPDLKEYKFINIVKNASGILQLVIHKDMKTPSGEIKRIYLNLQCTAAHLASSLKNLCESFNVQEEFKKDDFNILQMNENNINNPELKEKVIYYLQNDVLSLAIILQKHFSTIIKLQ